MNWSNLAPNILEKVMFYSARREQQRDEKERGRIMARQYEERPMKNKNIEIL